MATKKTLAQLRANPRWRATLPLSSLTPEQRARRLANTRRAQPLVPGSGTTVGEFESARRAAADTQFGPQEHAISLARRQIPAWYASYQQQLARIGQGQQQGYQTAQATAQNLSAQAADTGGSQSEEAQKASRARQALSGSFAALLAAQGATAQQDLAGRQGVASAAELQKLQGLSDAGTELGKRRGEFYTTFTQTAKDTANKNVLEQAAFGLDQDKAKTAADQAKADADYKRAQIDIKRGIDPITGKPLPKKPQSASDALAAWKLQYAKDHGVLPSTGTDKPKPKKTAKPTIRVFNTRAGIHQLSEIYKAKLTDPGTRQRAAKAKVPLRVQIANELRAGNKKLGRPPVQNSLILNAAADLANFGYVLPEHVKVLRETGVTLPPSWTKKTG